MWLDFDFDFITRTILGEEYSYYYKQEGIGQKTKQLKRITNVAQESAHNYKKKIKND